MRFSLFGPDTYHTQVMKPFPQVLYVSIRKLTFSVNGRGRYIMNIDCCYRPA